MTRLCAQPLPFHAHIRSVAGLDSATKTSVRLVLSASVSGIVQNFRSAPLRQTNGSSNQL
jgi:hypothetical protein